MSPKHRQGMRFMVWWQAGSGSDGCPKEDPAIGGMTQYCRLPYGCRAPPMNSVPAIYEAQAMPEGMERVAEGAYNCCPMFCGFCP